MADEPKVWLDGNLINESDGKVPILTHSLQYGSGIFEGIRSYETAKGSAVFRLDDHIKRFLNTARTYYMDLPYEHNQLKGAILEVLKANHLSSSYIRPFAFYNDSRIGVHTKGKRISVFIAAISYGAYFGNAKDKGLRCKVSSWHRITSSVLPIQAKASGNYLNSIIANSEVVKSGFDEAIMTSAGGYVAEGPGSNIFLVKDGVLVTPNKDSDILLGITRDSIIKMAHSLEIPVEERFVHREELYSADEIFFSGTAAEVTPIVNVDNMDIGEGKPGKVTLKIADKFSEIVHGRDKYFSEWLTQVPF